MLIAGLFTRMVGLLLAGEMAIAMWKGEQFFQNPLAVDKYELALAFGVGAFALATFGAGSISLDPCTVRQRKSGTSCEVAELKTCYDAGGESMRERDPGCSDRQKVLYVVIPSEARNSLRSWI